MSNNDLCMCVETIGEVISWEDALSALTDMLPESVGFVKLLEQMLLNALRRHLYKGEILKKSSSPSTNDSPTMAYN